MPKVSRKFVTKPITPSGQVARSRSRRRLAMAIQAMIAATLTITRTV